MIKPMLTLTDDSNWKKTPLSQILTEYKETCEKDGTYEHVSLTKEGVVPKTERYERDFLVTDESKKYRITHKNDICYNPANLKFGVICRNKYKDAIFSPIYVTFRVNEGYLPEFVELLVTRTDFINYSLKYQEGTVYERMAVSPEDLLSISVYVPSLVEQRKIADYFAEIDNVISQTKEEIEALEMQKLSFMQQIFSKKIRFKKDDGSSYPEWENVKMSELGTCKNGMNFNTKDSGVEISCLGVGDFKDKSYIHDISELSSISLNEMPSEDYLLKDGDIIFVRSNGNKALVGRCLAIYPRDTKVTFSGFCIRFRLQSNIITTDFLLRILKSEKKRKELQGYGSDIQNLNQKILNNLDIPVPCTEEQNKISTFFSEVDKQISLANEELNKWEELRKALLQKMFI